MTVTILSILATFGLFIIIVLLFVFDFLSYSQLKEVLATKKGKVLYFTVGSLFLVYYVLVNFLLMVTNDMNNRYISDFNKVTEITITNTYIVQSAGSDMLYKVEKGKHTTYSFTAEIITESGEKYQIFYQRETSDFKKRSSMFTVKDIDGNQVFYSNDLSYLNTFPKEILDTIESKTNIKL